MTEQRKTNHKGEQPKTTLKLSYLEQFLLRQLNKNQREAMIAELNRWPDYPSDLRVCLILEKNGDDALLPPFPDEQRVYQELTSMVNSCRRREWGAKSRANLVKYIALSFIPELMSFEEEA